MSQKDKISAALAAIMTLQSILLSNETIRNQLSTVDIETLEEQFSTLAEAS